MLHLRVDQLEVAWEGRSQPLWGILGFFFSIITLIVVLIIPRR
ncbi:MAG: hypothetical protein ACRDXE_10895 [Acidimicrobiales bacterium]